VSIYHSVFLALSLTALALGWSLGGHVERRATVAYLLAMLASLMVQNVETDRIRWLLILIDLFFVVFIFRLALTHDRWWLLTACAALLLVMFAHAALLIDTTMSARTNAATRWIFESMFHLCLIAGIGERWLAREPAVLPQQLSRLRSSRA